MGRPVCQVIIIGGGIGSLATAIGLQDAGHEVTLVERMTSFDDSGSGINVPPNASKCLQGFGVLEALKAKSVHTRQITIHSWRDGKVLSNIDVVPDVEDTYKLPFLNVHRADFHTVLLEKAKSLGVNVKLGSTVTKIDFLAPAIELLNGEVCKADFILGGDGDRSISRQAMLGYADKPYHSGDDVFSIAFPASEVLEHEDLRDFVEPSPIHLWYGPNTHVVAFALRGNNIFNIIFSRPTDTSKPTLSRPQEADMEELTNYFKDWDPRTKKLLGLAQHAVRWTLTETTEPRTWCHPEGHFALIGDAAHAMLPYLAQGAGMGLEDAATLSVMFRHIEHKSQIPDVLSIYERLRKPRTYELKRRSKIMRETNSMLDGPMQEERDRQMLQHAPFDGYPNPWADPVFQKWMWGHDAFAEAEKAWTIYKKGEWPSTRGAWKING
ncbi:hypothetical protein ACLMJK_007504 [Lecanora helva]